MKIGLPKEYFAEGLDSRLAKVIETAIDELRRLGAEIREISLPNTGLSIPTYYVIAMAEASSNLSRFDGVRFGHRCADPVDLEDLYKRSRGEGFRRRGQAPHPHWHLRAYRPVITTPITSRRSSCGA